MTLKRDGGSTVDEEAVGHFNGANSSTRNEIEGLVGRDRAVEPDFKKYNNNAQGACRRLYTLMF